MTIRSLAGLTLIVAVGAAGEGRAQDAPLTTLARTRVELAGRGQPTALTVRRVYDADRAARAVTRRFRRAELVEDAQRAFAVDLEDLRAEVRYRRLKKTNVELRQRHRRLTAELQRLRR